MIQYYTVISVRGETMNVTFLIGNGFDIGMGMNSRFKDFFPIYQALSRNKDKRIRMLADEIGEDYETWAAFEVALGQYTVKFDSSTKQDFLDQLKDFEHDFIDYLKKQEDKLVFANRKAISDTIINALTLYYTNNNLPPQSENVFIKKYNAHKEENHTYNFINFNYTQVLEKCLATLENNIVCKRKYKNNPEKIDKINKVVHVHGKCDLHPIIGVNDISQIENKDLANDSRFSRYIVKPSLNQLLRQGNDNDASQLINQSDIICVYGMSLGITDKKWWGSILSWLSNNDARQLVLFDYDDKYNQSNQFDWLEKEDALIDTLSVYSTGIDVQKLRPRIHIAVHKNIFEIDLAKESREVYEQSLEMIMAEAK